MEDRKLKEILATYTQEEVTQIQHIQGEGEVNDVAILATAQSKYVIRVDPSEDSTTRFEKERWCMKAAKKVGIPVPDCLAVGMKDEHPFMLISFIEGIVGTKTDAGTQKNIWNTLGRYAKKISSIKTQGFGERITAPGIFDGSWLAFVDYNISNLNADDKLLQRGVITSEQSKKLKDIFIQLRNTPFKFGLIHHDLSLKNTILANNGTLYLLDWGSAEVHALPHMDIAQILYDSLEENSEEFELFLKGFGMGRSEFENMRSDISRLELLTRTDKVRWAIDKKPELVESKIRAFKQAFAQVQ